MSKAPISEFIALDCETTGLNPKTAEIIEIALFRFAGDKVLEKLKHLVNPGVPIPLRNKRLTGITDDMVAGAPTFSDIAADIFDFIGDSPLVGHNITSITG